MQHSCKQVHLEELGRLHGWQLVRSFLAFHFMRRYPSLGLLAAAPRAAPVAGVHRPAAACARYAKARNETWARTPCPGTCHDRRKRDRRSSRPGPGGHGPSAAADPGRSSSRWSPLLVRYARNVDWDDVSRTPCSTLPRPALLAAIGLALPPATSLYSCFDLLGRRYTGHDLAKRKVMAVNFISYAFNLNLGSLVGGVAFRYRLYSRLGLDNGEITRILVDEHADQLAGLHVAGRRCSSCIRWQLPPSWKHGQRRPAMAGRRPGRWWRWPTSWPACARASAAWTIRGHELILPPLRMAGCSWPCRASTGA